MALKDIIKQINSLSLTKEEKEEIIQNVRSIAMNPRLRKKCFYNKNCFGISDAFIWMDTEQGYNYWNHINNMYKKYYIYVIEDLKHI